MSLNKENELTEKIIEWGEHRNIYHPTDGANMASQLFKLVEEMGETFGATVKGKSDEIKDGIGDTKVCQISVTEIRNRHGFQDPKELTEKERTLLHILSYAGEMANSILSGNYEEKFDVSSKELDSELSHLAKLSGFVYSDCMQQAYDDIKDRKGTMKNRVFVKEADLVTENQIDDEEKADLKVEFCKAINVLEIWERAEYAVAEAKTHYDENKKIADGIESKFQEWLNSPEKRDELASTFKIQGFDEYFDEHFPNAKEFKEKREALLEKFEKVTEQRINLIQDDKHIQPDGETFTEEFIKISEEFNKLQDELNEMTAPIMPFGEVYRQYLETKIIK